MREPVRFCPAGHDTFLVGRALTNRRCNVCRSLGKVYRQYKRRLEQRIALKEQRIAVLMKELQLV